MEKLLKINTIFDLHMGIMKILEYIKMEATLCYV